MTEPTPCGRCLTTARDADVRLWLVDLEREHRRDRVPHTGPAWDHQYRCRACREATRTPRENRQ